MGQVFAVSKAGVNVLTATAPNDFIFHSDYNTFKILAEGTAVDQTVSGNPTTFTLAHGLGYAPNFYAFCKFPDGKTAMAGPLSFPYDRDTRVLFTGPSFTVEADDTNLYFILTKPAGNYDVDLKWYIFEVAL